MSAVGPFTLLPQRTRISFNPQTGTTYEFYHEGPKSIIEGLAAQYVFAGLRGELAHEGQLYTLMVQAGSDYYNPGVEETPVDSWEIDSEYVQENFWSSQRVIALAQASADTTGGDLASTLSFWRSQVEATLKENPQPTPEAAGFIGPNERELYRLRYFGVTATEVRRIILRRVRTVSLSYANQVILDAVEKVWLTSALARDFALPNAIVNRLPTDPDNKPTNSAWGWKLRSDQSRLILRLNRVEEQKSWTFAAWSQTLYEFVT